MTFSFRIEEQDWLAFAQHVRQGSQADRWSLLVSRLALVPLVLAAVIAGMLGRPQGWPLAGAFVIVAIVWFTLLPRAREGGLKKTIRRLAAHPDNVSMCGALTMTLADDGLHMKRSDAESKIAWSRIAKVERTDSHIFLYVKTSAAIVISRESLEDASFDEVWAEVHEYLSRQNVGTRHPRDLQCQTKEDAKLIYGNSLRPSTVFGLLLLLLAAVGSLMWVSLLLDERYQTFDMAGLILLGCDVCFWVLAVSFFVRARWSRVVMSLLLHAAMVGLLLLLMGNTDADETIGERLLITAVIVLATGCCVMGILVLHSRAMKRDLAGRVLPGMEVPCVTSPWPTRRRNVWLVLAGVALLLGYAAWRLIPLLTAEPTIAVDYLAQANVASKPADYDPNLNAAPHYARFLGQFNPVPEAIEEQWKSWPADLQPEELDILKSWALENEQYLDALAQATACPYWWREMVSMDGALAGIKIPELEAARQSAWGIVLLAKYQAQQGRPEEALAHLCDLYGMGVHWTEQGTLVEQLVGVAQCKVSADAMLGLLDNCQPQADALRKTLASLQERVARVDVPYFAEVEELYGYDAIQRAFSDDGEGNGRLIPKRLYEIKKSRPALYTHPISYLDAVWICLNHPDRLETTATFEEYFDSVVGLARQTPWQLWMATTNYEEEIEEMLDGYYYLSDGCKATAKCICLGWRGKTDGRGVAAVLAVLTSRAEHGIPPASLDALVEDGLLDSVPLDPYSDGPLVYRVNDRGFTLYSVGEDLWDNEGTPGRWGEFGTDRVFWPVASDF